MKIFKAIGLTKILLFALIFFYNVSLVLGQTEIEKLKELSIEDLMNLNVITVSKSEQKLKETPAMVFVITSKMIKEKGYSDLFDVLNSTAYFQIQSEHGHWTKGGIINLRGNRSGDSGNNKVLLLIDGIKISDYGGEGLFMGLNSIPLYSIKQIEIAFGPNSTLYGKDAYAGMINLITNTHDNFAGYSYGTFNSQKIYAGVFHKLTDDFNFNINLYSYKSDEQDPTSISKSYKYRAVFPKKPYTSIFYRASKNNMISLGFNIYDFSVKYILFDILASETYGSNPNLYATEYSTLLGAKNQFCNIKYEKNIIENLNLSFDYNYTVNEFNPMTANLYLGDLDRMFVANKDSLNSIDPFYAYGGRKYYYFRTRSHNFDAKAIYNFTSNLKNVSGFSFSYIDGIPVISEGKGGNPITTDRQRNNYLHNFNTMGFFTEFSYRTSYNLLLTAGGRYDYSNNYGNTFMPRVSAIYNYGFNVFKAVYSTGFLAPSITQVYFESVTTFSWIKPNENLKPETTSNFEFNYDYINKNFRISTNIFYSKFSNIIAESVENGDSVYVKIGNDSFYVPLLQSENIGIGEHYGLNIFLLKRINRMFETDINYSLLLGYDDVNNKRIKLNNNLIANHKINLGLTFNYKLLSIYGELIWISDKKIKSNHFLSEYAVLLDENGYLLFKSALLTNLNIRLNNLFDSFSMYLRIKNLFNHEYYGQTINAQWGSPMVLQDMRRIDLGIELSF